MWFLAILLMFMGFASSGCEVILFLSVFCAQLHSSVVTHLW